MFNKIWKILNKEWEIKKDICKPCDRALGVDISPMQFHAPREPEKCQRGPQMSNARVSNYDVKSPPLLDISSFGHYFAIHGYLPCLYLTP